MSEIKEKITEIIVNKLNVESSAVVETADITNDLGADSLDVVELIMELEREFDIEIPDTETQNMVTVGDVVKFVEDSVSKKQQTV